ncbi:MAG: cysteine--tRNA ligase [Promethearchaeota archaeon]
MKIYNSLTFKKEEFKPLRPNEVLMYVCGPTVYDSPHLGHAKSAVAFDLIRRYFTFKGYNVKLVKNYTDIDDKIIKRANERNIDFKTLSEQYIKEYEDIMKLLNVEKDYKNPRATEVINFIIELIQGLIRKGYAYEQNGSIYFSVNSFPEYKKILQNVKEAEEEGDSEDQDTIQGDDKRNRRDFALWKKWKEGEPFWESPWGRGRPGWHIECSAMAINFLGESIDIHGGGQDLKFPHHRNEISQSEAYTGKKFANYFIHNGFVNVNDEKMSKSLGNFFLVSDVAKEYDPIVIRLFLLSSHYRKSVNYSLDNMTQAKKNYGKMINLIKKVSEIKPVKNENKAIFDLILKIDSAEINIFKAMDDDFNTPVAIAEIMTLFREINKVIFEKKNKVSTKFKDRFFSFIKNIDAIFGIFPITIRGLELDVAGSFDKRGELINKIMVIISKTSKRLCEEKIYDINRDILDRLKNFWIRKELNENLENSFDKQGKLINDLLELFAGIISKLEEKKVDVLGIENYRKLTDLYLKDGFNIEIADSFDKRGELINKLLRFFTDVLLNLREKKLFEVSNFICEIMRDFWGKKDLDLGLGSSFDKRGELIDELLDILFNIRKELRTRKIYNISDYIRGELKKIGIYVEDF